MSDENETLSADVIISGGGPVGLALAIELGQRGVSCIVIERHAAPQPVPKGQNLTPRTMENFRSWNCESELRAARTTPMSTKGSEGLTAYGSLLSGFHYDWLNRKLVRPYYAANNERLPQYCTEAVLRDRVAQLDCVTFKTGWTVTGLGEDADGVRFEIEARDGSGRGQVHGRYAVGADGSRSRVRELAGLTQTLFDHDRMMMLLVFRSPELNALLERFPGKGFFNVLHPDYDGYWLFFGRVDSDDSFFFHAPMDRNADPENFDYHAFLEKAVGASFDATIEYRGFWDCRVSIADSYGQGRVFIAGDAAHSHPPYGGYGINTGFEDARNLGWKLAATLKGWGGADLLASYGAERRPVFWSTAKDYIEASIERDRAFLDACDPARDAEAFAAEWKRRETDALSEVLDYQPHYAGSPVVFGPDGAKIDAVSRHEFRARAGYHLAPRALADGRSAVDLLGSGFTLLSFGADPAACSNWQTAADALGIPLEIVAADPGGEAADYEARTILVRPDHFVAWTGDLETADPGRVLRRVAGLAD